tara:strand:- start:314 stop:616 length:303 start_codon:yes stop_codon:yes gene_type:complete
MKNYEIEYRDCTGMRCGVVVENYLNEKLAIHGLQLELMDEGDYMTELIDIQEVNNSNNGWTLEDGTPLDENDQELLNYAFDTYVNEDGLTIKEVIDSKNE